MAEYIVEVNQDNTIDLPTGVRDKMALQPGDKMIITFDDTEEHLVVGKLPMEPMENAAEIEDAIGRTFGIKEV